MFYGFKYSQYGLKGSQVSDVAGNRCHITRLVSIYFDYINCSNCVVLMVQCPVSFQCNAVNKTWRGNVV